MGGGKIKTILLIAAIILLVIVFVGLLATLQSFKKSVSSQQTASSTTNLNLPSSDAKIATSAGSANCGIKSEYTISGSSLSGIIESGQKVYIIKGYYDCHPVQRNDVVAYGYNYAKDINLIIKVVKAIPGDVWTLQPDENGNLIIVNGQPLKNSYGDNYVIPFEKSAMLTLYVQSYPTIPSDAFLILGNQTQGTVDSTRFGLIGLKDIVGKVIKQ